MAQEKTKVIFIIGPTAVGKTALGVDLAGKLNGEIISADSMQIYKGMDIGTAKPSKEELAAIPHHLIDLKSPKEHWSVSDFVSSTVELIGSIAKRNKVPIVVGGTGLYLFALLEGFSFPEIKKDIKLREKLEKDSKDKLYARLKKVDPLAAKRINMNDKKRVIRAIEVYETTGQPISSLSSSGAELEFEPIIIGLNIERPKLNIRIEARVDKMLNDGLINEVEELVKQKCDESCTSLQAIGYKEVIEYLKGRMTKEEMIAKLKQDTRNFAKRQMTWFKRFKNVTWYDADDLALHEIHDLISKAFSK